jgi:hypothetical protein
MIARSRALELQLRSSRRKARGRLEQLVAAEVARSMYQCGPRHTL